MTSFLRFVRQCYRNHLAQLAWPTTVRTGSASESTVSKQPVGSSRTSVLRNACRYVISGCNLRQGDWLDPWPVEWGGRAGRNCCLTSQPPLYLSPGRLESDARDENDVTQHDAHPQDPKDTPPPTRVETRDERKERKRKERQEQHAYKLEQDLALWDPASNGTSTMDPFKTLFVARIPEEMNEHAHLNEIQVP
ncbi:U1 small nuclear ribonucleoprotein 70 kDa-like [Elysia marginata]|uniref:U1 small nuclear ribonucleoprotein 70 kDa-like n=1 Tax=Elysia marginata TaxID=1093978 RepID=A0AAV4FLC0_9GAST|nr:U1 small nuclear ribonucleoprotein 70 kDa-like [Elysia marginata]